MLATLPCPVLPFDLIAVEQVSDRAVAALYLIVANRTKESHQRLPENRVIVDRHNQTDVVSGAQRVEGRAKAIF